MPGERNTNSLIKNLKPILHSGQYVFAICPEGTVIPVDDIVALFREEKGITLIMEQKKAIELGMNYTFVAAWITLMVHSSLEAVGLTARVADSLAKEGISCNAVAAYYHDHIFIPYRDAQRALAILSKLK
jgi:hypothetical protein